MRKFLLAFAGIAALAGPAGFAADQSYRPVPPPAYLPPPLFSWTGLYVGGQIGYGWSTGSFNISGFGPGIPASINAAADTNPAGVSGGGHAGYQYQFNQLVLGVEGSIDGTSQSAAGATAFPFAFKGTTVAVHSAADAEGTIRGKMGIALDRVLIYGTGGVAFGGWSASLSAAAPNLLPPLFASASTTAARPGWTAGGGLEYAITNDWWLFAEYRFADFGSLDNHVLAVSVPTGGFLSEERRLQQNQVQAGFSYRFDLYGSAAAIARP